MAVAARLGQSKVSMPIILPDDEAFVPRDPRTIAFHEAGHAVGSMALKLPPFAFVQIRPRAMTWLSAIHCHPYKYAIGCLCGPVAQAVFERCATSTVLSGPNCRTDLDTANMMLAQRKPPTVVDPVIINHTERLVVKHWGAITRVAELLLDRGRLDYPTDLPAG